MTKVSPESFRIFSGAEKSNSTQSPSVAILKCSFLTEWMFASEQFHCLEVLFSVHPRRLFRIHVLHVRPVFLRVMCSQMQNVNATPLTAPRVFLSTSVLSAIWFWSAFFCRFFFFFSPGGLIILPAAESARLCRGRAGDQQPPGGKRQVQEVEDARESASAVRLNWSNMDSSLGVSSSTSS